MGVDLKFTTAGAPDHTYYSLLKFGDNNKLDATLRALSDGQGNDIGIKISTTQVSIDSTLIMGSLTASKLVYLNASKELVTIADGTAGQALVTDGAGGYSFASVSGSSPLTTKGDLYTYSTVNARLPIGTDTYVLTADSTQATGMKWAAAAGGGITINSTAITSGTAGRILFENASNQVSEAAGLTYSSGLFTVLGTTQQAKFAYDASNHLGITIGSTGNATFALTGTTPVNIFNQSVGINMTPTQKLCVDGNIKVQNGYVTINPSTSTGSNFALKGRALAFPVPYLTPTLNNTYIAFDIFPKGSPSNAFGSADLGVAWFDICSTDIEADGTNYECVRLSKLTSSYANLTTAKGGPGTVRDLVLQINGGNIGVNTATVSAKFHIISTTEQFRSGYDASNYAKFTTGSTGSLTIALAGTAPRTTFSQGVTMGGTLRKMGYTVATLPSGVRGDTAYVTDATAPTYLGALTGGGAVTCPVFYNGTAWISA